MEVGAISSSWSCLCGGILTLSLDPTARFDGVDDLIDDFLGPTGIDVSSITVNRPISNRNQW